MYQRLFLFAAVALSLLNGACGSSTTQTVTASHAAARSSTATSLTRAATTSATSVSAAQTNGITKGQAAKAYVAALPPYRAALFAFDNTVGEVLGSRSASKAVAISQPLREAITKLNDKLSQLSKAYLPAAANLKHLVMATAAFKRDLGSMSAAVTAHRTVISWVQKVDKDHEAINAAAARVRSNLGLRQRSCYRVGGVCLPLPALL